MSDAVDRLVVKLARVWVPPHVRVTESGERVSVKGYWREVDERSGTTAYREEGSEPFLIERTALPKKPSLKERLGKAVRETVRNPEFWKAGKPKPKPESEMTTLHEERVGRGVRPWASSIPTHELSLDEAVAYFKKAGGPGGKAWVSASEITSLAREFGVSEDEVRRKLQAAGVALPREMRPRFREV